MRIAATSFTVIILLGMVAPASGQQPANGYNPFQSIGKKGKITTAYGNRFVEVFDYDSVQRIGSVLFHTYKKKIVRLLKADSVFQQSFDNSKASRWYSVDPMAYLYFSYSPYNYTLNNPVRFMDPDGRYVVGETRSDTRKFMDDLNTMLKDKAFDKLRDLVGMKGKRINAIDEKAFGAATEGLNEDQKALAQAIYNTVNSADEHVVEYVENGSNVSENAAAAFAANILKGGIDPAKTTEVYGGIPALVFNQLGGAGTTVQTTKGSYTVMVMGLDASRAGTDYVNLVDGSKGGNPAGRASTAGHEVLGHGRSLALGRGPSSQQADAIRMENLILRVMGLGNIQRDGTDHSPGTKLDNPSKLPGF
jgi:hypothetical protein